MTHHCVLIHVRDRNLDDLSRAGLVGSELFTPVEDAASAAFTGIAAMDQHSGVTLFSGTAEYLAMNQRLADELQTEVVAALFHGVSDTYGWFVEGGQNHREWVYQAGALAQDVGEPLPDEADVATLDEDALFALFVRRTGIQVDWTEDRAEILRPQPPRRPGKGFFGKRR